MRPGKCYQFTGPVVKFSLIHGSNFKNYPVTVNFLHHGILAVSVSGPQLHTGSRFQPGILRSK